MRDNCRSSFLRRKHVFVRPCWWWVWSSGCFGAPGTSSSSSSLLPLLSSSPFLSRSANPPKKLWCHSKLVCKFDNLQLGGVFPAGNALLIFIYFLLFLCSMISFGFLVRLVELLSWYLVYTQHRGGNFLGAMVFLIWFTACLSSPFLSHLLQCLVQFISDWSHSWLCRLVWQLSPISFPPTEIPRSAIVSRISEAYRNLSSPSLLPTGVVRWALVSFQTHAWVLVWRWCLDSSKGSLVFSSVTCSNLSLLMTPSTWAGCWACSCWTR